jgi:cation-transporting ATPase E
MLSYSYLITVFVSFIVLLKICLPFNAYRLFIFLLCASPVLFVINFLSHYLSILPLFNRAMLMVLPMLGVSLLIEEAYARMIHFCVKYHVVTYLKQWFKKCKKHVFS